MWTVLTGIGGAIAMAAAAYSGLSLGRRVQKAKGARAAAMMMLAFMGMFNFIPPETTTICEPSEEMKIKKGANPGDPPELD